MDEENEAKELAQGKPLNAEQKSTGARKQIDPTLYLVALLTILVLSISYFFVFALPKMKEEQLALDRELAARRQQIQVSYNKCVDAAEADYENYIKLNGSPVAGQAGAFSAPEYIWDAAEKNRKEALEECVRQYRP